MCGLIGLIGDLEATVASERVQRALRTLRHRGPDGEGLFVQDRGTGCATLTTAPGGLFTPIGPPTHSAESPSVVLGHRRLAILDPSPRAAQPMATADGRYVLILNGEIYNFIELRSELEAAGDRFVTSSDTEVLLKACVRWGTSVLDRLVGMFAFALFDREAQALLLARDSFGMKPLYWGRSDVGFGFASEPATLLTLLDLPAVAEGSSLADYLVLGVTDHRPATMFAGIQSLPPASWLRVPVRSTETPALTQYWRAPIGNIDDRPAERIARDLRDRFLDSVRLHLRSDVRVGTLLSGGIDSSAIVMSMRVAGGPQLDIRTFSYIPEEGTVSEERWIDEVNQAARAIPHKVRISRAQWESDARVLAERQGEPFGTLAVYAQSRLFGAAADQGVKVLLDGQGADEMLAGYGQFRGARIAAHLRRQEFARAVEVMLALRHDWSSRHAISAFVDALRVLLPAAAVRSALRLASTARKTAEPWLTRQRLAVEAHWRPEGARLLQERLRDAIEVSSLPALLRYVDRSSMMHGVESRLPFVTRELAEFALALPDHLLVSDSGLGKVIFRQAMRGIVPDSVLDRREKIGFAVPLGTWLLGSRYVADRLASAAALPCVNGRRVRALTDRLAARRPLGRAETFVAWRLLGLAEWSQQYGVAIT